MASTRSKNTPGDYNLEQRAYQQNLAYLSYDTSRFYAQAEKTYFPGQGLIGMKSDARVLSGNSCDIESQLRGIGSTNLVAPSLPVYPEIYPLQSLDISSKVPLVMPQPFLPQTNQRPLYRN